MNVMYKRIISVLGGLLLSLVSQASGPYHAPCESEDEALQKSVQNLKYCLDQAVSKKRPDPSEAPNICKTENNAFQDAARKSRECRLGPPPASTEGPQQ